MTSARHLLPWFAKALLFGAVVVWVYSEVSGRLAGVAIQELAIDDWRLTCGALVVFLASGFVAPVTFLAQRAVGVHAGFRVAMVATWGSAAAKYVPGKVASLVGAIAIYRTFGVPVFKVLFISLASALATFSAAALMLFPAVLGLRPAGFEPDSPHVWVLLAAWAACSLAGLPTIGIRLLKLGWKVGPRAWRSEEVLVVNTAAYMELTAITLLQMVMLGFAFWLIITSMVGLPLGAAYGLTIVLLVSGLAGLFAFFAPAGIGVREGLMLTLLGAWGHQAEIAVAVVLLRVFQLVADAILTLLGTLLWRQTRA